MLPSTKQRTAIVSHYAQEHYEGIFSPVPSEFTHKKWVWYLGKEKDTFLKMSPHGINSLKLEAYFMQQRWSTDSLIIPTLKEINLTKDFPFVVLTKLPGNIVHWEEFKKFKATKKELFAKKLAETAWQFHSTKNISGIIPYLRDNRSPEKQIHNIVEKWNQVKPDLSEEFISMAESLIQKIYKLPLPSHIYSPCLQHNDLNIQNFTFNEKNEPCGIFDFGNACFGAPISDFKFLLNADWELGHLSLQHWCHISKNPFPEDHQIWKHTALAALSGLIHRHNKYSIIRAKACLEHLP